MMKYLLIPFLLGCFGRVFGQSVTINDLTNISNLSNAEAHNYLVLGKKFKQQYLQDIDGNTVEHLGRTGSDNKQETVIIGVGTKLSDGTTLRTVTYTTVTAQYIINLVEQAKHQGLKMKFQGTDAKNDIYLFDNDFFHIAIYLNHNDASGLVEVHQKEYLGFD